VLSQNPFTGDRDGNDQRRIPEISVGPDLRIRNLELPGVFPALYPTYRRTPFGTMEIVNSGTGILTDLTITVAVPGVLAAPVPVDVPGSLVAGRSLPVELTGSVSPDILSFGQGRTLPLSLELAYRGASGEHRQTVQREMLVYNRNALRWSDDRRVGAFVTVDDSDLVGWTGEVLASLERPASPMVTREVLAALHLFGALSEQGIRYVVDPSSAYAERSQSGAIDYLRFPRETLRYRAGDCDDLSVLYNTLLEIAGVSTAFITTPGHIFTAFDSGLTAEEMQRTVSDPRQYLVHRGQAWIPVETTALEHGFVAAWQTGAQQWLAAQRAGTASFFVTADAWQTYRPVAVPERDAPAPSTAPRVSAATDRELAVLWDRHLEPLLAALESRRTDLSPSDYHNRMGVLNAQYGRLDTAAQHFDQALRGFDYLPALINRANVAALQGQNREARVYLERAAAQDADNSRVLLGLAWAQWRSGDHAAAEASWRAAESLEPRLAAQYPLVPADSAAGTRAASSASAGPFSQEWSVTEP
jgi:tetratricopeptide (TPR) repeat protein